MIADDESTLESDRETAAGRAVKLLVDVRCYLRLEAWRVKAPFAIRAANKSLPPVRHRLVWGQPQARRLHDFARSTDHLRIPDPLEVGIRQGVSLHLASSDWMWRLGG